MNTAPPSMPDLHLALIELRRASSRIAINEALKEVLRQASPLVFPGLRQRLAQGQSLPGPHRVVADPEDVL